MERSASWSGQRTVNPPPLGIGCSNQPLSTRDFPGGRKPETSYDDRPCGVGPGSNPPHSRNASARGSALNEPLETGAGLEMVDGLRPFMCRQEQRGAGN